MSGSGTCEQFPRLLLSVARGIGCRGGADMNDERRSGEGQRVFGYDAFFKAAASARPKRFSKASCAASQRGFSFFCSACPWALRAQRRCRRSAPTVSLARPAFLMSANIRVAVV